MDCSKCLLYEDQISKLNYELHCLNNKLLQRNQVAIDLEQDVEKLSNQVSVLSAGHSNGIKFNSIVCQKQDNLRDFNEELEFSVMDIATTTIPKDSNLCDINEFNMNREKLQQCQHENSLLLEELSKLRNVINEENEQNQQLLTKICFFEKELAEQREVVDICNARELDLKEKLKATQNLLETTLVQCSDAKSNAVSLDEEMSDKNKLVDRGNSLYAELEDRRVRAELLVVELQKKLVSLKETNTTLIDSLRKRSVPVDEERVRVLERQLAVVSNENKMLRHKVELSDTTAAEDKNTTKNTLKAFNMGTSKLSELSLAKKFGGGVTSNDDYFRRQLLVSESRRKQVETDLLELSEKYTHVLRQSRNLEISVIEFKNQLQAKNIELSVSSMSSSLFDK